MTQRERENFYRNSTAIVDHGNAALTLLLENELANKNESITDFLNRNQHEIYHLYENKRQCCQCVKGILQQNRVLHLEQINLLIDQHGPILPLHRFGLPYTPLLCCRPAKTTTTLNDMDITLKRSLLVNFATNCLPCSTVRQAVENLVEYRNKLYGHAKEASMTDTDFQKNFANVEKEILFIARFCNAEIEMRQKLQDTKIRPLDEAICLHYQSKLLSEIAKNSEIQEDVLELKKEIGIDHQNIKNQLADINVKMEHTFSVLNEMQREQTTSVEIFYDRVKASEDHIRADIEASKQLIATKIDCLEHQTSYKHMELHCQVEQAENNLEKCIIEVKNVISKEITDLRQETAEREERETFYLDETIKPMQQIKITDQRKRNIIAQTKSRIKLHTENVNYVETRAVKEGEIVLDKEGILFLVSKGGAGKTTTCLQLASIYQDKRYVPMLFIDDEIKQYRDVINPHEKSIVIIDDLFGRTNVEFDDNIHTNLLDILLNLVTEHKGVKLIFTIREKTILFKHRIFNESKVLDLDQKWQLSPMEKTDILLRYMDTNKVYLCKCHAHRSFINDMCYADLCVVDERKVNYCEEQVLVLPDQPVQICKVTFDKIVEVEPYIGFPEACRLFCSDRTFTVLGIEYFESPTQSQVDKMKAMFMQGFEKQTFKYQYCILVYIALQETEIAVANNLDSDAFLKTVFDNLFDDKNVKIKKTFLEDAFKLMEGTMLEKDYEWRYGSTDKNTEVWKFKHETICEAVRMSVANECPEMFFNFVSLPYIFKHVKPRTSSCNASSQSVKIYILDDVLIKKFESAFNQQREKTKTYVSKEDNYFEACTHCSLAYEIGTYIRKCALVNRNDCFVKRFFELIPLNTFPMNEISDLFDGLTKNGKDKSIVHYHAGLFNTFNCKWFSLNVTLALCRPERSNLKPNEYIFVDDKSLALYLSLKMESLYDANIIYDIGRFLLTVGMQEGNHSFVKKFLRFLTLSAKAHETDDFVIKNKFYTVPSLQMCKNEDMIKILINCITNEGEENKLIPFYFEFFNQYLLRYGSLLVILKLCTIPGEPFEDQTTYIVIEEHDLIKRVYGKFRYYPYGILNERNFSRLKYLKKLGSALFSFLMRIRNKAFIRDLLRAFDDCYENLFIVSELLAFFNGLTNNGENLERLKQNYPFVIEQIEKKIAYKRFNFSPFASLPFGFRE